MRWPDLLAGLDGPDGADAPVVLERTGAASLEVASVTQDHRRVAPGACFVCVVGAAHDGHDHAPAAVARGAVALVVERTLALAVAQARVADSRAAVGPLAARLAGDPSRAFPLLGVTGTNGKTTTVHLLDAIGRATGATTAMLGTLGVRIAGTDVEGTFTTPPAEDLQAAFARMRDDGVTWAAMEVSSHALAQRRVDGSRFACVGFANLTHDHLDFHETFDAYFEAKARLFTPAFAARAVVNVDDPLGPRLLAHARGHGLDGWAVSTTRTGTEVDVAASAIAPTAGGTTFTLDTPVGRAAVRSALVGRFNVDNSALAAALALHAGTGLDAVVAGLEAPLAVPGRLERVDAGQPFTVLVDYAHTPDSLARVLTEARGLAAAAAGRVLVVFGCGGDRDRAKRPVMGRVAGTHADRVWITDDNPRTEDADGIVAEIVAGAATTATPYVVERDRRAAIALAIGAAGPGDVVVVAGKGHERGQSVHGVVTPFDDREVARTALEAATR